MSNRKTNTLPIGFLDDSFAGLFELDREEAMQICHERITEAQKAYQLRKENEQEWNDLNGTGSMLVEEAEGRVRNWEKNLEMAQNGMLPPLMVGGNAEVFEAVVKGDPIDVGAPCHEADQADVEMLRAVDEDSETVKLWISAGRSSLIAAEKIGDKLVEQGADPELVKTYRDFMYSAGRFRERVALHRHERDVRQAKGYSQTQSRIAMMRSPLSKEEWKLITDSRDERVRKNGVSATQAAARIALELAKGEFPGIDRKVFLETGTIRTKRV